MRLMALSLAAVLASSISASAADVYSSNRSWTGVYLGISGGGAAGSDRAKSGCGVVTGLRDEQDLNLPDLCAAIDDGRVSDQEIFSGIHTGQTVQSLEIDGNSESLAFISEILRSSQRGGAFGAHAGLNYQFNSGLVIGGELSGYKFSGIDSSYQAVFDSFDDGNGTGNDSPDGDVGLNDIAGYGVADFKSSLDWLTKATLKLGMPVLSDDRGLIYGVVGGAVAQISASNNGSFEDVGCSDYCVAYNNGGDFFQFGAVVGAGLEYYILENVSLGMEYNYINFMNPQTLSSTYVATDGATWTYRYDAGYDDLHLGLLKLNISFN